MNPLTIAIGAAAALFGVYTIYLRATAPEKFEKLQAMKDSMGDSVGMAVHTIAYSIVPLGIGATLIFAGVRGVSLF